MTVGDIHVQNNTLDMTHTIIYHTIISKIPLFHKYYYITHRIASKQQQCGRVTLPPHKTPPPPPLLRRMSLPHSSTCVHYAHIRYWCLIKQYVCGGGKACVHMCCVCRIVCVCVSHHVCVCRIMCVCVASCVCVCHIMCACRIMCVCVSHHVCTAACV